MATDRKTTLITLNPGTGTLPWQAPPTPPGQPASVNNKQKDIASNFFRFFKPDPSLWDKLVDYRLLVIDTRDGKNTVVNSGTPSSVFISSCGNGSLVFRPMTHAWEFFLPITPQQLSIVDAYSISTSATLRGVIEEHSGTVFKNITVQGTMGVWPGRDSAAIQPGTASPLQSIFGGTLASAQNVAKQFTSIANNVTTGSNSAKPTTVRPDTTVASETIGSSSDPEYGGVGTGYYQTLMLTQFLEQYSEAKRNPINAGWRLVFDIPKQKQSFVVTPVGFSWNENVNHPMEINYTLQFKAWRRIDLKNQFTPFVSTVTPLTPGVLQRIVNTIQAAQNTAAAAVNLIGSVRSDVDNILNIIRQTGLLVKGLAGVAIAASDLPAQLATDAKSTISQFLSTVSLNNLFGPAKTDPFTIKNLVSIQKLNIKNEGLSSAAVKGGQLGSQASASASLNPSNAVFASPLHSSLLFGQVPVNSLTLNSAQQTALETEIKTVNSFTVADLKAMRSTIQTLCSQLANSFGSGNAYYSTLFNIPTSSSRTQAMTDDEFDILKSFYDLLSTYDVLTATNQLDNQQVLNSMEYVNALAATSSIPFSISNSKIQVPVPFGLTIEQIAQRYLSDTSRWLEIATLNQLREPYIDENGFVYSLLSNADGRNVVVGSDMDLFPGQTIYVNSSTQNPTARKILKIVPLSQTSFLLTLDGLANLSVFTKQDSAYIQGYLPGTVNSQNVIFIPSDIQSAPDDQISIPSSVANVDLVGLSKVDWLLTPQGDLAVTNTGDFRLAAGITNLVQALTIKFGTQLGTSLLYPQFGLGVKPGAMISDINAKDIYSQIVTLITNDSRFQGVSGLQINLQPPSMGISLQVQLAGQNGVFPISFQLPTTS